jgi:hypothetical protein
MHDVKEALLSRISQYLEHIAIDFAQCSKFGHDVGEKDY